MPLYLKECIPSLSLYGAIVSYLVVFGPVFIQRWITAKANDNEDDLAPTFMFGTYRLCIIVLGILWNLGRLIYECLRENVFAVLVAARLLCGIVQFIDHASILRNWVPVMTSPEKRQRRYLWLRLFLGFIAMLSVGFVQMTIHDYTVYMDITYQPDMYTILFVEVLGGNLIGALSMAFWVFWFRDGARLVKYRFHVLRNFLWTWSPFYAACGLLHLWRGVNSTIIGIGSLLFVCGVVIHYYMVLPEERCAWKVKVAHIFPRHSRNNVPCFPGWGGLPRSTSWTP